MTGRSAQQGFKHIKIKIRNHNELKMLIKEHLTGF